MPNHNEVWRESVEQRLDKQEQRLDKTQETLTQLMLNASTHKALGELEARVRELEKFQVRVLAITAVSQVVIAAIWVIISKYVFK